MAIMESLKSFELPLKRINWYNFILPSKDALVKAMYEIANAEIGAGLTKVPLFWRAIAKAECKEEFWDIWGKENEQSIANFFIVRVLLIGYTSEAQMEYQQFQKAQLSSRLCRRRSYSPGFGHDSAGHPRLSLVKASSSSPRGSPCASLVSCLLGEP